MFNKFFENLIVGLLLLLILNVFLDVILRYVFNNSSIALQEMEWHLFSAMFLLGISYTLQHDSHVRVDFLYDKKSPKIKATINILGFFVFILPISLLIIIYGFDFAYEAFKLNEQSGDPGGLTNRFIIKSIIPISFLLVLILGLTFLKNNIQLRKQ
ncbi:TRAP dicarboxylate transporter, DctQ subunit, unknown substrate 6 [hydrothermal vent metagenome]|uniref:Tripartite ATP-independent periplasmic transporters DctQ component domain-containing protein n=1 Tax=hydrothermal vent metagenome TaxID=652676 RepID=A0A1W1CL97_9ZZZZ